MSSPIDNIIRPTPRELFEGRNKLWAKQEMKRHAASIVKVDPADLNRRREFHRYAMIDTVNLYKEATWTDQQKGIRQRETISIVCAVAIGIIMVALPVGYMYLPLWAPLGIGIPVLLILTWVKYVKLEATIAGLKQDQEQIPLQQGFLEGHTVRAFKPDGERNLRAIDPRLKSDKIVETELKKRHPSSASRLVSTSLIHGLDLSRELASYAAQECVGNTHEKQNWAAVKTKYGEMKQAVEKGKFEDYAKAVKELKQLSFTGLKNPDLACPHPTFRDQFTVWDTLYTRVQQAQLSLASSVEEVMTLYDIAPEDLQPALDAFSFSRASRLQRLLFHPSTRDAWQAHLEKVKSVDDYMATLRAVLDTPQANAPGKLEELGVSFRLHSLLAETKGLEATFKTWSEAHPAKKKEAIRKQLEAHGTQIMTWDQLGVLAKWITLHPDLARQPIYDILDQVPKELRPLFEAKHSDPLDAWPQQHDRVCFKTPSEVMVAASKERKAHDKALTQFQALSDEPEAIAAFKENVMAPLLKPNKDPLLPTIVRAMFTELPVEPFMPERDPHKKRLEGRLQKIDEEMTRTHLNRKWILQIPIIALLVGEVIGSLYYPTPWLFTGFMVTSVALSGYSYFIDRRLTEMHKEKQATKLAYLLQSRPDIGVVPGTHSNAAQLKRVQKQYGLDGVTQTYARMLAHEPDAPTQNLRQLTEEGKAFATRHLQNRRLILKSLNKDVSEMTRTLVRKPQPGPPPEPRDRRLQRLEHLLERADEEMVRLQGKHAEFLKMRKQFDELERLFAPLTPDVELSALDHFIVSRWVKLVQAPDANSATLGVLYKRLAKHLSQGLRLETFEPLLPPEQQFKMERGERLLQHLQGIYGSGAHVDAVIAQIDEQLKQGEQFIKNIQDQIKPLKEEQYWSYMSNLV